MLRVRVGSVILIGYWIVMFIATHVPARGTPGTRLPLDKIAHFAGYGLLALLLAWVVVGAKRISIYVAVGLWLIIASYGGMDEWTQGFVKNRSPDVYDWIADVIGGALGLGLYAVASAIFRSAAELKERPTHRNPKREQGTTKS